MTNKVIHFEIPTEDLERAQKFYRDNFGWRTSSMPGQPYVLVGTTPGLSS